MNSKRDWSRYYGSGKDFKPVPEDTVEYILSHIDASLPKTCIDLGCGTGQLTRALTRHRYSCIGVDVSAEAIRIAKSLTTNTGITYEQLDLDTSFATSTQLNNRVFSLVVSRFVVAFLKDQERFIPEVYTLMPASGTFALITPTYTLPSEATPQAVDFAETLQLLERTFSKVSFITSTTSITCYICKK